MATAPAPSQLLIAEQAAAALTPEQRKYNQLVTKIEKARTELLTWQEQVPLFAQAYAKRVTPLQRDVFNARLQMVRTLAQLLLAGSWSKMDRSTLQRGVVEMAGGLASDEFVDEATEAELKALHDTYADESFEEGRRAALGELKNMVQAMSGVDLGDAQFDDEEALMQHVRKRLQDDAAAADGDAGADGIDGDVGSGRGRKPGGEQASPRGAPRPTAAQRRKEKQAEEASKSVREVYRKLASALHPDRATDAEDQARRTALMQRANQAYEAQDLLQLFTLQLEIEQVDAEHLARASTERMRHYNRVLAAQLDELKDEIESRAEQFSLQFGVQPWVRVNPHKLEPLIAQHARELRATHAEMQRDLRVMDQPAQAKRFIKDLRQAHRQEDEGPFGGMF